MTEAFDRFYRSMQESLTALKEDRPEDGQLPAIKLIREYIFQLRVMGAHFISDNETEIEFFREVWPLFHGELLFRLHVHRFENTWLVSSVLVVQEEERVARFFQNTGEFWMYYRSGAPVINEQFTRSYSLARLFEPLSLVIDPEGATVGSYRAACCMAMDSYGKWLAAEKESMGPAGELSDYSWGSSDHDYVEWLYGLWAVGAIRYKGKPVDISRVAKWGKLVLGKWIVNLYDRFNVIRNRKKDRIPFTRSIQEALEKKMDEADDRQD